MSNKNKRLLRDFFVYAVIGTIVFSVGMVGQNVYAFGVRAVISQDPQFVSVLFDANVSSTVATSSQVVINSASTTNVFVKPEAPSILFVTASGTVSVGDTVTVSSSVKDNIGNLNNTTSSQNVVRGLKIAEVRSGTASNNLDEYVMLYNITSQPIVASGTLFLHSLKGATDLVFPLAFSTSTVPGRGFFLIASALGYSGSVTPDATYSTSTDLIATSTTAIYLSATSTSVTAIIDKVEWGASAQISSSTGSALNSTSTFAATAATTTLPANQVLVRKAANTSASSTMQSGGTDSNKGNSYDTRDNSQDFVILNGSGGQNAVIKNSQSPPEFPFGGGVSDTTAPTVAGSFPSSAPGEIVPTDLSFIGFGFSKPIDPTTVTSSTVSLVVQGQTTNLCTSVILNNMSQSGPPGQCTLSGSLTAGTTYVFTIKGASSTPSVQDFAANKLNQPAGSGSGQHRVATNYQITFSPQSGFSLTPTVPPQVIGTFPAQGASGIATNVNKISISFSQAMDATTFGGVTLKVGAGSSVLNNASVAFSSDGTVAFIPISGSLTSGATYTLIVPMTVKNSKGISLGLSYTSSFVAGASGATAGPIVVGKLPNVTTGVPVNAVDIHVSTDGALDASTVSTTTVQVTDGSANVIPGAVSYDPVAKEIIWIGTNAFLQNTAYTMSLNATGTTPAITNVSSLNLQDTDGVVNGKYQFTFTTAATPDTTGPAVGFANANTFSVAVTFSEAVKKIEAENIANYALTSAASPVTLSSFNGNIVSYDAAHRTAKISNVSLTAAASFSVAVSNIHDLSGNVISPTQGSAGGTVQSAAQNGGGIGVGGGFVPPSGGDVPSGFSSSQFGFVPQPEVRPFNGIGGFTSRYGVNLPISKQVPASGKIVMVFPNAFTLGGAAADSFSPANSDINGPGAGAVTISTVQGDDTAHTVTVTLGAVATQSNSGDTHDFLHFDLSGIGNPPTPNSNYTVDVRTVNGTTTLESVTSKPFAITAGGSGSLTVTVNAASASGGTATVYLFSPQTGPLSTSTAAFSGGSSTAVFASLPSGAYNLGTDPFVSLTGGNFLGRAIPLPISVSGAATSSITLNAVGALASTTVNVFSDAASRKIDIFGGGSSGFIVVSTTTISGTSTVTLFFPAAGEYSVGVGPQMQKTFSGPPSSPDYVTPKPVQVHVAAGLATPLTVNLSLTAASLTIAGTVTDASGKVVANGNVFAYSSQGGFGTFGQSGSDGTFRLKVAQGNYKIGANAPGFPGSQEIAVIVDVSGNLFINGSNTTSTSITLKLSKPGTKITGKVTDGTNAVQNAQVWAYCDPSTTNNACFGPNGHAEAQTDSSGAYTLYAGNGTWRVAAFIPGYGQQPETTTVIAGSDVSLADFRPSATGSFNAVSGTVCTNTTATCSGGVAVSGAMVRIEGTDPNGKFFSNNTVSASDGTYSFASVPSGAGSSYRVRGFAPTLGELPATAAFTVTADVTAKDLVVKAGRTVNINVIGAPATFDMMLGLTNVSTGVGNFVGFRNNTSGTLQMSNGGIYALDIRSQGFSVAATNVTKSAGTATYSTSTGQLDLSAGSDTIILNINMPSSTQISGTVKDDANTLLASAWVDVTNPSSGLHFGSQANTSGAYSLSLQDGSYTITGFAPGYVPNPKSLTLSGGTITFGSTVTAASAINLVASKTSLAISGTIKTNGTAAPNAFIKGIKQGGGTNVVIAGADGTYSLPVSAGTWTVSAVADGYKAANYASNPVTIIDSSVSSVDINLTTNVTLAAPTVQSIVPTQGGTMRDSGGKIEIRIPANALGSSGSTGQIKTTETSNLISTATARPIGTGQDVRAYDSSNNAITTLSDNVDIVINVASSSFAANSITSTSTASKLKLGYFDSSLNDWVSIASTLTYKDASGVPVTPNATLSNVDTISLTGKSSHFSVFGAITTQDSVAPAAPTNVTATVGTNAVAVAWTAPTTNSDGTTLTDLMEFEIYRDADPNGNFTTQVNTSQVASTTTSFTDTTVSGATTYYYKVTAADTSSNESAKSSRSAGAALPVTNAVGTGGGVPSGGGGGGGGGYIPLSPAPATTAKTPTVISTQQTTSPVPTAVSSGSSPRVTVRPFTAPLRLGSRGGEVIQLQKLLAKQPDLYPNGEATGYFGSQTRKALERFQEKYGIAKKGDAAYGTVGPKTRAKLNELNGSGNETALATPPSTTPAAPATSGTGTPTPASQAQIKEWQSQLVVLLQRLAELLQQQKLQNSQGR